MELNNKTVVITGASEGIGKAIALQLAKEQTQLVLIARNRDKLQAVAELAQQQGASSVGIYACDISQTASLTSTCEQLLHEFPAVDVLINNAGVWQKQMPIDEVSPKTVDEVIATNLSALIHLTRLLLPTLRQQQTAAVINVVSKSGVLAQAGQSVYTASKYGVRGFTEVLKEDLKNTVVKVAGVYQSGTKTQMFEKAGESIDTEHLTEPDDLAAVIAFMLKQPKNIWLHDVRISR